MFATTRWSIVLSAGRSASPDSRQALESLCEANWQPLYAYVRRRVHNVAEAQDLTQSFFAELLEKNYVGTAAPERGRFRAFLLTACRHFLSMRGGTVDQTKAPHECARLRYAPRAPAATMNSCDLPASGLLLGRYLSS